MKINIAYAPDDNFINLVLVSMVSALENNANCEIEFIILYSNLLEKSIEAFNTFKKYENCKIRLVKVDEKNFKQLPLASWTTVQTWFRTALAELCPDLDKVLYLDCDTLILGDLSELFSTDLSGNIIAGVTDIVGEFSHVKRLNIADKKYFNAGAILFNTEKMREEKVFEKIKNYSANKKLKCADQDAINKILENKKLLLHPKYNYLETWEIGYKTDYEKDYLKLYEEARTNSTIIHFVGLKPLYYKSLHSFKYEWWKYAQKLDLEELKNNFLKEEEQFKWDIEHFNKFKNFIDFVLSKIIFSKKLRNKFKAKVKRTNDVLVSEKYVKYNEKIKELF